MQEKGVCGDMCVGILYIFRPRGLFEGGVSADFDLIFPVCRITYIM